ncbi:MAG: beta-propeller domain-containing protein [Oscillospiraceae bacterium]|nr:beta-propeller domain-containing protein [Oscillospiraceae bacterium]
MMFENKKAEQEVSQQDIMQSKRDIKAVQSKLKKFDAGIPKSEHVSSEYLLSKQKKKVKQFPVQTVITAAAAAVIVIVAGTLVLSGGIFSASKDDAEQAKPEAPAASSSAAESIMTNTGGEEEKADGVIEEYEEESSSADAEDEKEAVYAAGSYSELLKVVEGAAADFSHVISMNANRTENDDGYGIIGNEVVKMDCEIILQTSEEFTALSAVMLDGERTNVFTYGNKRVFSVSSEEMGELIGIEDTATGELLSVIKLGAGRIVKRLVLDDDKLVVIGIIPNDEENSYGAFDATLVSVFNLADGYLPVKDERFAAEGELFTVITNSGEIFVVIRRFAVGRMNMSTMEIEGMDYIPTFLYNSTVDRIAPSNIYISSEMASMDYLIIFKVDGEEANTMAYLGAADPLVAINYLIEKIK